MQRPGVAYHEVNQRSATTSRKWRIGPRASNTLAAVDSRGGEQRELTGRKTQSNATLRDGDSKRLPHYFNRLTSDSWVWELLGIFVCIAALVSIFGILLAYDQKPLPHNFAGVSLNTAISILATISRATVISVAAQIIAQQKWVRFMGAVQPLSIVALYDDATRGPLGSFFLLLSLPRSITAIAVALVTVLALGFEPFVQQSLSFPLKESSNIHTLPTIRATTNISYSDNDAVSNKTVIFDEMLLQALFADSVTPLQPTCASSSCKWSSYTSAAMCSSCVDVLENTIISSNDTNAVTAWATGDFLDDFQGMVDLGTEPYAFNYSTQTNYSISVGEGPLLDFTANFTGYADDYTTIGDLSYLQDLVWNVADRPALQLGHGTPWYPNMTGPLTSLAYVRLGISKDGTSLEATSASVCTISLCAQEQIGSSVNGTFTRNITKQEWGNYSSAEYDGGALYTWAAQNCIGADAELIARLDSLITSLEDVSTLNVTTQFSNGTALTTTTFAEINPASNTLQYIADTTNTSAKIAQVFSNYFDRGGKYLVSGEAFEIVPFVNVRWAWLCFPIIIVLVCAIFLFITIYQSHRIGLRTWTTSPFPLLFGYSQRDQELRATPSFTTDHSEIRREAQAEEEVLQSSESPPLKIIPQGDTSDDYAKWASKERVRLTRRDKHWIFENTT